MAEQGRQKGIIGRELGIAFVGVGRMGSQRATIAATHPAVRFLAVSDIDPARARAVGEKVKADLCSGDNLEVISRPEVNAVVVSTPEHEHTRAVLQALELGKPVLVEKPIAHTLEDADRLIEAADWVVWQLTGGERRNACPTRIRLGFSMLFHAASSR